MYNSIHVFYFIFYNTFSIFIYMNTLYTCNYNSASKIHSLYCLLPLNYQYYN